MKNLILSIVLFVLIFASIPPLVYFIAQNQALRALPTPSPVQQKPIESETPLQEVLSPTSQQEAMNVSVFTPEQNQSVGSTFLVRGMARVFENVVSLRITKKVTGDVLLETTAYANAPDVGQFGEYEKEIDVSDSQLSEGEELILQAYQASAKDGSDQDVVTVPLLYSGVR